MGKSEKEKEEKKIDWMITLVPFVMVVVLCILFFFPGPMAFLFIGISFFRLGKFSSMIFVENIF